MRKLLILAVLLAGCDPWPEIKKTDTIEAYENYMAENPDSLRAVEARARLEQLYVEKARAEKTIEAYDAFLSRFPKGDLAADAAAEREEVFWTWAEGEDTPEAWARFISENGKSKAVKKARSRQRMAENKDKVEVGEPTMKKVNLAEDPKGELNGWGFYAPITIKGDKPVEYLNVQVRYLDANGKTLGSKEWPLVASALPGNLPFADGFDKPMKPGETRTWEYTAGFDELPEGWTEKIAVVPVGIRIVGETEAPSGDRNVEARIK